MASTLTVISQPAIEPVTLDLARRHCRIDHTSDDDLLAGYLSAARVMAERYLSRCLITQTLQYTILPEPRLRPDRHFLENPVILPRAPVQSLGVPASGSDPAIDAVVAVDDRGNRTVIPAASLPLLPPLKGYIPDLRVTPPQIRIGVGTEATDGRWLGHAQLDSLTITFVAGYGDDGVWVPQTIIQGVLMLTAHLYEQRGDVGVDLPKAVEWMLDPDRLMWA